MPVITTEPMPLPAYVVSLIRARERREEFERTVPVLDHLQWRFFDAHTSLAPQLHYDDAMSTRVSLRPMRAGELGCYSSHVSIWQEIVDTDCPGALILEDDVIVDWPFVDHLSSLPLPSLGIHYLRLFSKVPFRWRYVKSPFVDNYHHLVRIVGPALGTQGYFLSQQGARRFLARAKDVTRSIDAYMDAVHVHGVPNLALYPFPLFERSQRSSIGDARLSVAAHHSAHGLSVRLQRKLRLWSALVSRDPPDVRALKDSLPVKPGQP